MKPCGSRFFAEAGVAGTIAVGMNDAPKREQIVRAVLSDLCALGVNR